jgi:hypothetical protein
MMMSVLRICDSASALAVQVGGSELHQELCSRGVLPDMDPQKCIMWIHNSRARAQAREDRAEAGPSNKYT